MTEKDFWIGIGNLTKSWDGNAELEFRDIINNMEVLLDQADEDDYFGTEGWRHQVFDE